MRKFLNNTRLSAGIAIAADFLALIAGIVLNALRSSVPSDYTYTDNGSTYEITVSHQLDVFALIFAVMLIIAAAMSAVMLIGAVTKHRDTKKGIPTIIGAAVLLVVSAAVILFSYFFSHGEAPSRTQQYSFTDEENQLVLLEEQYNGYGMLRIFLAFAESGEAELLVSTDIAELSESPERYEISWVSDTTLTVSFTDKNKSRMLQINVE